MTKRFIRHITLTTGHVRDSYSAEVSEDIRTLLQPLISHALTGRHAPIPSRIDPPGCTITGGAHGRCISLTIWAPPLSRLAFPHADESARVPLTEIGIASHSRCGAVLWRSLHDAAGRIGIPVRTDSDTCPPEPWVAALLYHGAAIYTDAMHWLGDFERCLAWAWVGIKHDDGPT